MDIKYGRKRKGIKAELKRTINNWLKSIDDESVREIAKQNTIVTGGAIASMLLGEKVNDWDVYFRTKDAAFEVADYYCKRIKAIYPEELIGAQLKNAVNIKGDEEERVTVHIPSIGIWSSTKKAKTDHAPAFASANAISLTGKLQLITRFYGEPDQIHSSYDYAHAMCYWDHDKKELHLPSEALECLLSRTLVYKGSLYPVASIFRAKKFIERGWRISAGELLKIMWQISEIDLSDHEVLEDQLTGVDVAFLNGLIRRLKDTPKEDIDSSYVVSVIEEVFS